MEKHKSYYIKIRNSNKKIKVDKDNYLLLRKKKWYLSPIRNSNTLFYARDSHRKSFQSFVIRKVDRDMTIDHINGDGLDNRRVNLRICSQRQNLMNRKINYNSKSGYKGVYIAKKKYYKSKMKKNWRAFITINKKAIFLGYFFTKDDAALAYNKAAIKYFKEFARLNIIKKKLDDKNSYIYN